MIKAYINGVEYEMTTDFSIAEQIGNNTSSTINIRIDDQPFPSAGDVIQIKDDTTDTVYFYGTCGIPKSPKYNSMHQMKVYTLTCGNANSILENRIANVAYQNTTISEIVQALFDTYISAEGITLGHISNIPVTVDVYTAGNMDLKTVLNELADTVQAIWKVTNDRQFVFVAKEEFPKFPFVISANNLIGAELQHETKSYKLRTVQIISGASDTTALQTESFVYDGEQDSFTLRYPVSQMPSISVNGTLLDSSKIGVVGLDDDREDVVFLFAYNSTEIDYNSKSEFLNSGDQISISYVGLFSIRVTVYNDEKIKEIAEKTGTSGLIERVQIANNISTMDDAVTLGNSLLEQFSEASGEITFWLESEQLYRLGLDLEDTSPLTSVTFDLPEIGITGEYVISERTLSPIRGRMNESPEQKLKITLKLVNRDYLKSYGEIIRDLQKDIAQLSFREDEIIVDASTFTERTNYTETMLVGFGIGYYACADIENGSLFAPCDLGAQVFPS